MIQKVFKVLILLIFFTITIYLCFRNYKLEQEILGYSKRYDELLISTTREVDTIFLPQSEWDKRLNGFEHTFPQTVLPIKTELLDSSNTFSPVRNYPMSQSKKDTLDTAYSVFGKGKPKVSFTYDKNLLSIYVPDLGPQINTYKINTDLYNYKFHNGVLTSKIKPFHQRLDPYVEFTIRPINQFYDLSSGVSFETSRFNYKVGFNLSYYPKFSPMVMKDIQLSVIYKF